MSYGTSTFVEVVVLNSVMVKEAVTLHNKSRPTSEGQFLSAKGVEKPKHD